MHAPSLCRRCPAAGTRWLGEFSKRRACKVSAVLKSDPLLPDADKALVSVGDEVPANARPGVLPPSSHRPHDTSIDLRTEILLYQETPQKAPSSLPMSFLPKRLPSLGLTKQNEVWVGRYAMLGWALALVGEGVTGKGVLEQIGYGVGAPSSDLDWFIVFLVGFNLVAAVLPTSGRFFDRRNSREWRSHPDRSFNVFGLQISFGVHEFGFTRENELFVGRVAQLGFAAGLIGELLTGKGPLAQLRGQTSIPHHHTELALMVFVLFMALLAVNEGSGKAVCDSDDDDVF